MQDCHVDDYNKGRFDMIMDRDILTWLSLKKFKFSEKIIEADDGPLERVNSTHGWFGYIYIERVHYRSITPEVYVVNTYIEEVYESEHVLTYTKLLNTILYAKYKKQI